VLKRHPLSAAWPDMTPDDFAALRDSIAVARQREPIVLFENEVLDGWQRYQACLAEGINPCVEPFASDDAQEAADYVRAKHTRRPLTATQRLTAIALMATFRPRGVNGLASSASVADDLTVAKLASQGGAAVRTAASVKAAVTRGTPELVESMRKGEVPASRAEQIAKLPAEEQSAALKAPCQARNVQGKPKKVPATKWVKAEIEKADAKKQAEEAEHRAADLEEANRALAERVAELEADNASMAKVFESNEQVAAAVEEAKQLRDLNRVLNARVQSMLSEIAALKRTEKSLRKKLEQPA